MDAAAALADLMSVSSQVRAAVLVGPRGGVQASTSATGDAAAAAALALAQAAEEAGGRPGLTDVVVSTGEGAVFVVRDGGRTLAATTSPDPTVGLVLYDLRATLRAAGTKPKPRKKASDA
jgi:predicted regulator of Ras-like GTPase activity (Roadblock/LC7/MglB family)